MASRYKPRRNKLKSHDSGEDRHNKGVALNNKVTRLNLEHQRVVSSRPSKKTKPVKTLRLLEIFDSQQS